MSTRRPQTRSRSEEKTWLTSKTLAVVGAVLLILIAAPLVWGFFSDDTPAALQGRVQEMPDEGRDHVPDGTTVEYESEPPTSGPHYARWAQPDIYREVIPDEMLVHNLEHGHIVIYYHPTRITDQSAAKITELTRQYDGQWDAVLAVPRPEMDFELVLTAWTFKLELDEFDEELIDAFVDAYRGRGPENPIR
jgi:hypothetical protein